jgi:hypothetical protein
MPRLKIYHGGKPYRDFRILSSPSGSYTMESCSYDPAPDRVKVCGPLDFVATPAQVKALDALGDGEFQILIAEDGNMVVAITKLPQGY